MEIKDDRIDAGKAFDWGKVLQWYCKTECVSIFLKYGKNLYGCIRVLI